MALCEKHHILEKFSFIQLLTITHQAFWKIKQIKKKCLPKFLWTFTTQSIIAQGYDNQSFQQTVCVYDSESNSELCYRVTLQPHFSFNNIVNFSLPLMSFFSFFVCLFVYSFKRFLWNPLQNVWTTKVVYYNSIFLRSSYTNFCFNFDFFASFSLSIAI